MSDLDPDVRERLTEVVAAHRFRDVLGDYEVAPYYRHFGCSCGWEQNIAGMSGWRSWLEAHDKHVADALVPVVADIEREAERDALRSLHEITKAEQRGAAKVREAVAAVRVEGHERVTHKGPTTETGWLHDACSCGEFAWPCPHVLDAQVRAALDGATDE